jgi:hypothetical protein
MEQKRIDSNKAIRKVCQLSNTFFLKSGKVVFDDDGDLRYERYAEDGLHLSNEGIIALSDYIVGSIACLMDGNKKLMAPKPKRKRRKNCSLTLPAKDCVCQETTHYIIKQV